MSELSTYRGFFMALIPAAIGGAIWASLGMPLAWLMGSAIVTGLISYFGLKIKLPKFLYRPSLAVIGASVGLTITPSVAIEIAQWFPLMAALGLSGILFAAIVTPWVSRKGDMQTSTAFFSLMPGGIVEMANIGEAHGGDSTTIATLHAIRTALVVGILPMGLFFLFPVTGEAIVIPDLALIPLLIVIAVAVLGGWLGERLNFPAAWLLGSLVAVAIFTVSGVFEGQIPVTLMAIAQVFVGISLGAKFQRERLNRLPKAMFAGSSALIGIILLMATIAIILSQILPFDEATMVLAMSIGGVAEMVLTARSLELNMAIVAAFQALRGILVNASAGFIWNRYSKFLNKGKQ